MSENLRCPACGMFDGDHAYGCAHVSTEPTPPASQESAGGCLWRMGVGSCSVPDAVIQEALRNVAGVESELRRVLDCIADSEHRMGQIADPDCREYDDMLRASGESTERAVSIFATLTAEVSRLTGELDAASARLHEVATLCATVEQERDRLTAELADRNKAVIAQAGNARALADALKTLTQAARISGGVAGADSNLMAACDKAENALSLTGVGCAVNAVLDVIEQRDSLRDECERLRVALREAKINAAHAASQLSYVKHEKDLLRCAVKHVAEADTSNKRVTVGALIHITQEALFDDAARQSHRENNEMAELAALSASGREGE